MDITLPIHIRPLNLDTDLNFVLSSFIKSYVNPQLKAGKYSILPPGMDITSCWHDTLKEHLSSGKWTCHIASYPTDHDSILGYIITPRHNEILYIYTKDIYRREKVASRLIAHACPSKVISFTLYTPAGNKLIKSLESNGYSFNLLRYLPA